MPVIGHNGCMNSQLISTVFNVITHYVSVISQGSDQGQRLTELPSILMLGAHKGHGFTAQVWRPRGFFLQCNNSLIHYQSHMSDTFHLRSSKIKHTYGRMPFSIHCDICCGERSSSIPVHTSLA